MAPKGRAKSNGSKLAWETEIVTCELSDAEWSTQVHFILGESTDAALAGNNRLKRSVGTRQKFSLITADMVLDTILDKKNKGTGRFCEVLDSCKTADNQDITDLAQLHPTILAKLVKFMLLKDRDADLARLQAKAEKAAAQSGRNSAGAKGGKKTPTKGKKGKETPEPDIKKEWSNLKKRGEVDEEEEKEEFIDDEPDDGPTHYTLLSGFSDSNLPLLLSEMSVELSSIVQLKEEAAQDAAQKFEFWDDLTTIFRRGLGQKRLVDCTRWQLTIFEHDTEGTQLFDEIASLCYDLMDQYKAFTGFSQSVKLIPVPSSDVTNLAPLKQRYQHQLEQVPLVAQSVNVITHAIREAVVQCVENVATEEKPDIKDDLNLILHTALSSMNLSPDEKSQLSCILGKGAEPVEKTQNVVVHFGDQVAQKLAGMEDSASILEVEAEMMALNPANLLFQMTEDERKKSAQSHLANIDYNLAAEGSYTQSQMKRILLQMSTEAIPKTSVDAAGNLIPPDVGTAFIPWDNPEQIRSCFDTDSSNLTDLSQWNVYERHDAMSTVQEVSGAIRDAAASEVLPLNRETGAIVLCHDPLGSGANQNQNLSSWSETVISDLGFRQWMEHIQPSLADWLRQWELEQTRLELLRQQEELQRLEAERVSSGLLNTEPAEDESKFILPGSLKAIAAENAKAASESELKRKKSSRKSLKGASAKNSRTSSRANSKTKLKKSASRSSSRNSHSPKGGDKVDRVGKESERADAFPQYCGYSLNNTLLVASGRERRIYTGDGGRVKIKQSGFVNQCDNMSICVEHGGNAVHFFQSRPRDPGPVGAAVKSVESLDDKSLEKTPKSSDSQISICEPLDVPLAAFSSVSGVFSDGLSVSYSAAGTFGRPPNFDAEFILEDRKYGFSATSASPTPSRDTATPKGRAKSPKGKGKKEKSDMSLSQEVPSKEDSEVSQTDHTTVYEESSLQQLYISTPDGMALRFGLKNEQIFVRLYLPDSEECCRYLEWDQVVKAFDSGEYEIFNFDGSIDRAKVAESGEFETEHVTPDGICSGSAENAAEQGEEIQSYTGTDPTNGEKMTVRADGFTRVVRESEEVFQFPDGTRVTKGQNDVEIEKPGVPCVLLEEGGAKCLVVLANGTLVQVEANGTYHLSHQSGASFAVGEDGTVLFTPQPEQTSTHIIRQQDTNALEIIEPDGLTTIQVSNTGKTSVLHAMEESEETEKASQETLSVRPRYFYLRPDRTALEFFQEKISSALFQQVEQDPMSAAIFQQVPEAPHEKAVTLLSPFVPNRTWAIRSYQEESIVPQYLRQKDLKKSGERPANFFDSHEMHGSEMAAPMLTMRNFVIAENVTEEMKRFVWQHIKSLGSEQKAADRELEGSFKAACNDERSNGAERRELLDRFLQLASEPDTDSLRQSWTEATRPPPPPPVEPPKPKLTEDDWAKIKRDAENTRNGLDALKKRDVPNYWQSESGKRFLAAGDQNVAAKAAKELPPKRETDNGGEIEEPILEYKEEPKTREPKAEAVTLSPKQPDTERLAKHIEMEKIMGHKLPFWLGYRVELSPNVVDFGNLVEGQTYSMDVKLRNAGYAKLRYKICAPPNSGIDVKYKIGPLACGLSAKVTVIFKASGGVLREDGIYDFASTIDVKRPVGEAMGEVQADTTLPLPVIARIIPLSEVERLKVLNKPCECLNRGVKRIKS